MKMHPEFNLGSIISKISISDIKHSGLTRDTGPPQSDFLTLLDKAQAHQADLPVATAIATLNKSGMDLPSSDDYIAYANPLDGDLNADPRMMFETVKLLNGRSVLTTRISVQPSTANLPPPTPGSSSVTSDIPIAAQVLSAEHWSLARSGNSSSEGDPLRSTQNQAPAESESASLPLAITRAVSDQVAPSTGSLVFSSAPAAANAKPVTPGITTASAEPVSNPTPAAANTKPVTPDMTTASAEPVSNPTPAAPIATSNLVTPKKIATANATLVTPVITAVTAPATATAVNLVPTAPITSSAMAVPVMPELQSALGNEVIRAALASALDDNNVTNTARKTAEPVSNPTPAAANTKPVTPDMTTASAEPVSNPTPAAPIATSNLVTPKKIATANATLVTPVITAVTAPATATAVNLVPTAPITSSAMAVPVMPELQSALGNEMIRAALASALDDNNVTNTARKTAEPMSGLQSGVTRSINRVAESNTSPTDIDSETGSDEVQWQTLRTTAMPPLADARLLRDAVAAQPASASPDQPLVSLAAYRLNSGSAAPVPETESTPVRLTERWMAYDDLSRNLNSVIHRAVMDRGSDGMVRMRIFLTPENMGTIEAEVVEGRNSITINLLVQSEEVAKLLRDSSSALRELLSGSGMNQVNVTIASDSEAKPAGYEQSSNSSGHAAQNTIDEPKSAPTIATSGADGSIDTYV